MSFESDIQKENNMERYKAMKRNATNILSQLNTWQNEYTSLRSDVGAINADKQIELDNKRDQFISQIRAVFGI